jgi:hypothetical protein
MILSPLYPQEGNWPWAELGFGVRDGTHAADLERMEGLPSSAPQLGLTMRLYGGAPRTPCLLTTFSFAQQCPGSSYSAEAEYAAASQTCREMTYIRNVCGDLGLVLRGRLCLAVDNTAAIAICENPGVTARNKHFSDAVHYVRHEWPYRVTCFSDQ